MEEEVRTCATRYWRAFLVHIDFIAYTLGGGLRGVCPRKYRKLQTINEQGTG